MSAVSWTLPRPILRDTPNAISSQESASGHTPSDKPDGRTTEKSGQGQPHASRSAQRVKGKEPRTSGIYGLSSFDSSEVGDLASSLANRLQAKVGLLGSTMYRLTWKVRTTPSGRSIPALRASVPRTSDRDSTGWPTPAARDWKGRSGAGMIARHGIGSMLPNAAHLVGWPTPQTFDATGIKRTTPEAIDLQLRRGDPNGSKRQSTGNLREDVVAFVPQLEASGEQQNGSTAETTSGGQLNPAHSRWLMGPPPKWDDYAPTETPSSLRKRRQ